MSSNSESLDAFDAIILGTGLSESILAAALSRVGYSVLHLDRNTYYGELESTHSLNGLLNYTENHAERLSPPHATLSLDGDQLSISLPVNSAPSITNLSYVTYNITDEERSLYLRGIKERDASITKSSASPEVSSTVESEANSGTDNSQSLNSTVELEGDKEVEKTTADAELAHRDETKLNRVLQTCISLDQEHGVCEEHKLAYLTKKSNKFILDLTPKLLFSRSEMIELLITSDVARYCEFRSVSQILTLRNHKDIEMVPCSRADIFSTKSLSMIEKRILMKVLTLCMNYEEKKSEFEAFLDKPFVEFLKFHKLTPSLMGYILDAIAMVSPAASLLQGLERTQLFLKSIGRYGPTPFLWPLYGGEINQAFCRMSAVFGGTYILNRTVSDIIISKHTSQVTHIVCNEGKEIKCKWLIVNADYTRNILSGAEQVAPSRQISRAIVVTSGSLRNTDGREETVLLSIPALDGASPPVTAIELGSLACVCPKDESNLRVVHLTTLSKGAAEDDLHEYVDLLFTRNEEENKPRMLLACYFNMPDYSEGGRLSPLHPTNLYITPGPDANINPDNSVLEAKRIFQELCPGAEFIPRPPNPEDIIYCDEQSKAQSPGESFAEEVSVNSSAATDQSAKEEDGQSQSDGSNNEYSSSTAQSDVVSHVTNQSDTCLESANQSPDDITKD